MAEWAGRRLTMLTGSVLFGTLAIVWLLKLDASTKDDFFISYTFARNLVEGNGFVFNPGERVFGLTNPGFTFLLALLNLLTRVPIHILGVAVSGFFLVLVALLLLREGSEADRLPESALGGFFVLGSSFVWSFVGGEWSGVLALFLASALVAERRPALAGLLMGLAVWFRPDAGIGVALLGLLLWAKRGLLPWRYGVAAGVTIAVGALAAWLYYGSFVPNSFVAKKAVAVAQQYRSAGARFWNPIVPSAYLHFGGLWPVLAVSGGAGLVAWWRSAALGGRLLILYAVSIAIYYPLSRVEFFGWYIVPCAVVLLMGVPYLICGCVRVAIAQFSAKRLALACTASISGLAAFVSVVVFAAASSDWYQTFHWNPRHETYRRVALWLAANLPREERVAYVEIGILGYFGRHPVQDLMGLVSPEVLPFVERGDIQGAFLVRPTEIVLFHTRGRMGPVMSSAWFSQMYEQVAFFEEASPHEETHGMTVFRRRQLARVGESFNSK